MTLPMRRAGIVYQLVPDLSALAFLSGPVRFGGGALPVFSRTGILVLAIVNDLGCGDFGRIFPLKLLGGADMCTIICRGCRYVHQQFSVQPWEQGA